MKKRLFYAIELDARLREQLTRDVHRLRQIGVSGKFTRPDNLHLTLQFLGEIDAEQLTGLIRILQETALACMPFTMQFTGLGSFGKKRDILWLGLSEQPELYRLQRLLTDNLTAAGLPCETRPYQPHLTLVRQARYRDERVWQEKTSVLRQKVTSFSLMESTRYQGELRYLALARQSLLVDSEQSC